MNTVSFQEEGDLLGQTLRKELEYAAVTHSDALHVSALPPSKCREKYPLTQLTRRF